MLIVNIFCLWYTVPYIKKLFSIIFTITIDKLQFILIMTIYIVNEQQIMNEPKLTITELTQKVNEELKSKSSDTSTDARYSSELSERRVRDYISKKILDKPFGQGRDKWYGQKHVDKLVAVRQLQSDGLSDQSLKRLSATSHNSNSVMSESLSPQASSDQSLRSSALDFISGLESNISGSMSHAFAASASVSPTTDALKSYYSSTEDFSKLNAMNMVQKQVNKVWNEYQLDEEGKVFLKVESNTKIKNGQEILSQIKSILNIQGDKND